MRGLAATLGVLGLAGAGCLAPFELRARAADAVPVTAIELQPVDPGDGAGDAARCGAAASITTAAADRLGTMPGVARVAVVPGGARPEGVVGMLEDRSGVLVVTARIVEWVPPDARPHYLVGIGPGAARIVLDVEMRGAGGTAAFAAGRATGAIAGGAYSGTLDDCIARAAEALADLVRAALDPRGP